MAGAEAIFNKFWSRSRFIFLTGTGAVLNLALAETLIEQGWWGSHLKLISCHLYFWAILIPLPILDFRIAEKLSIFSSISLYIHLSISRSIFFLKLIPRHSGIRNQTFCAWNHVPEAWATDFCRYLCISIHPNACKYIHIICKVWKHMFNF